jgi:hypothetical protein
MVQHVLLPVNIHFHWKSFHFWIFSNLFSFYIGGHFEMAAILKIFKTKSTTLSDDLFMCQVSKGSAVQSEFNIFATCLPWQRPPFWFFSIPKSCHTLRWISLQSFMKLDERNKKQIKSRLLCFHGNCGKVCPTDSDFLAYLVPLDVDVVHIKFHQFLFCE